MRGGLNINKRRFALTGSIGMGFAIALVITLLLTGTVFAAVPLAGVGGFAVQATSITGNGFELIPSSTSTNLANAAQNLWPMYPASQIWLDSVNIQGMNLYKYIDVSHLNIPGSVLNYVKVNIGASSASGTNMLMDATQIQADSATFGNMLLAENLVPKHPASAPGLAGTSTPITSAIQNQWSTGESTSGSVYNADVGIQADTMALTNPLINAHYLKVQSMTLNGMTVVLSLYTQANTLIDPTAVYGTSPWNS